MSKESNALMKTLHSMIEHDVDDLIKCLQTKEGQIVNDELTVQDINVLKAISLTSDQIIVVRKLAQATGRLIVFGMLTIIDGVSYVSTDIPDLALVNRDTRKDIADKFLHDEFIEQQKD